MRIQQFTSTSKLQESSDNYSSSAHQKTFAQKQGRGVLKGIKSLLCCTGYQGNQYRHSFSSDYKPILDSNSTFDELEQKFSSPNPTKASIYSLPHTASSSQETLINNQIEPTEIAKTSSAAYAASINELDEFGRTPLHIKIQKGTDEEIKDLLKEIENLPDDERRTLINQQDNFDCTPLHYAASKKGADIVNLVLRAGATDSINQQDKTGVTPLHAAAERPGQSEIVRLLLNNGADVNQKTRANRATALHWAAQWGDAKTVNLLFENGADIGFRQVDPYLNSLEVAINRGNKETVNALIEAWWSSGRRKNSQA